MMTSERLDVAEDARTPLPDQNATALSDRDIAMQFESLGGSGHGCEFGLFQRHYGAEPLGLLRWADLAPELLIKALESRFEGVGDLENTIIFSPENSGEWWTKDKRYWMAMRSFVKTADVTLPQMTKMACRRLQFLRRKLIEDLAAGEKIFAYKNMFRNLTQAELNRLYQAVRSYGDSTLFYVRYADEQHPAGSVEVSAPGLIIGYIEHFAFSPEDKPVGPSHEGFLALCRAAYGLWKGHAPAAPARAVVEPPKRAVPPKQGRRIVLLGNCQVQAMAHLYNRFVSGRTGDVLTHVASYQDLSVEGREALSQADLIVEQLFDLKQQADTDDVPSTAPRVFIPMVTAAFLWPFAGQPHPQNRDYPFLTGGPYGGEAADSYLNRQLIAGVAPEEAVEAYAQLDVNKRVNLDRLFELVMDRQRARDEAAGFNIADVIERHFRTEQIFLSPYHPNTRVAVALATQLFEKLEVDRADIERMQHCVRITPFPKGELPFHPGVCRHFGMDFVTPDRRYRFMNEGLFTFRDYALRYMRYEWNEQLEEGLSLVHKGKLPEARALLTAGLARSPRSAAGHNALSHVLAQAGAQDDAITAARRAVSVEPEVASYHATLGNLLRGRGLLEEAEAELRAATDAEPTEPHNHVLLAHLLRQRGRPADGAKHLREACALDPYSPRLLVDLADFCEASGDHTAADEALAGALKLQPDDAALYLRLAHIRGRSNRLDEAITAAKEAIRLEPKNVRYRTTLSDLLLRQGHHEAALIEALRAVLHNVNGGHAHAHLGHVLRATGDLAGAEEALQTACEQEPANAHFRHELSVVFWRQGKHDSAIHMARQATEREAGNPNRFAHLASFLFEIKDADAAIAAQRRAVDLAPDQARFRVVLSDFHARQGRLDDALEEARRAVDDNPSNAHALGHLAHVLRLRGELSQSEQTYQAALEFEPNNRHLQQQLADVLQRKAQHRAA